MTTPPAENTTRYTLTGVHTDQFLSGTAEQLGPTVNDPVLAATDYLTWTNAGFRTVLIDASDSSGTTRALPPPELMRRAYKELGLDEHGEPTLSSTVSSGRYQAFVAAQAACLDGFLRPADDPPHPAQPESLHAWRRGGEQWAVNVGGQPSAAAVARAVARYPDPHPDGPREMAAAARETEGLLRLRATGPSGRHRQRADQLRAGWDTLRFQGWGMTSVHFDALAHWWLDQLADHDPEIGPRLSALIDQHPELEEQARQAARQIVDFARPENGARFAELADALERDAAARPPLPDALVGVDLGEAHRLLTTHRAAELARARTPHTRDTEDEFELAFFQQAARNLADARHHQPPDRPTIDAIQRSYNSNWNRLVWRQSRNAVRGALLDLHGFEERINRVREHVRALGWEAGERAEKQARERGAAPWPDVYGKAMDAVTAPADAYLDALLAQQQRYTRQTIALAVPQGDRSDDAYRRHIESLVDDPVLNQPDIGQSYEAWRSARNNANRLAAQVNDPSPVPYGQRRPTQQDADEAAARAAHLAVAHDNKIDERQALLPARRVIAAALAQPYDRNDLYDHGKRLMAEHARELAHTHPSPGPEHLADVTDLAAAARRLREERQAAQVMVGESPSAPPRRRTPAPTRHPDTGSPGRAPHPRR